MDKKMINIFLTTIPGFQLPSTISFPVCTTSSVSDVLSEITARLPPVEGRLIITTNSNKEISSFREQPVISLLKHHDETFIPLRLSAPLCGGKGGFGSQLRAAGGRMSSKRKKKQGENNGSSRNLDGRRLRTVTEAKALAEYLAIKPKMEAMEKEARKKRWEQVVELAEKREDEIKSGAKAKVDGQWMEHKEEAGERTREAVLTAMRSGDYALKSIVADVAKAKDISNAEDEIAESSNGSPPKDTITHEPYRSFYGFEEDEEYMSQDSEAEDEGEGDVEGKAD